jgi:sugar phosphate isomerase/epimerase
MQIKYAISTMLFWGRENPLSFEQECHFIRSYGFGVELWPNIKGEDECRYNKYNWPRLLNATEGMLVALHSRNDEPTLQQWNEQLECAKLLKANIVTNLRSFGIPDGPDINGYDFSAEIVKLADSHKVKLCLETGDLEKLKLLGEKFESVYYCLDTGYANLDQQFTFKEYVDGLAERIIHLHLNDNYGQIDDHEPPGLRSGISHENWDYLLGALDKYDNDIIGALEMSPCAPAVMIRQASGFLFDELKWPNRPTQQTDLATINYSPH